MNKSYTKYFRYAVDAMELMAKNNISPRPVNYRVWYEFVAHSNPALNEAVDALEESDKPIDEDASVNLHNEFFNQGTRMDDAVEEVGAQLSEKLTAALGLIKSAAKGSEDYGSALESISTDLGKAETKELTGATLQSIVDTLVTATTDMSDHTKELETQLRENTAEVQQLRENLQTTKREALTDQLTKMGNRKHFDIELASAAQSAEKTGRPMCLIMSDVDKFKKFNDTWGHQTGDQVLRLVSACLKKEIRQNDVAARYGGEEFGIVLPDCPIDEALVIANKVRTTVESKKVMKRSTNQDLGTITISLGVALYRPGEELPSLIERADECLYSAKESGRNCAIAEDLSAAKVAVG